MEMTKHGIRLSADSDLQFVYDFKIPKDRFMNANDFGYARTWRQQCFVNHKRNENRKFLVQMGIDAAEGNCPKLPITKAFLTVECLNLTNRIFDPPNFSMVEKHVLDGLVQNGVFTDDNCRVIVGTMFSELEAPRDRENYQMRITVHVLSMIESESDDAD